MAGIIGNALNIVENSYKQKWISVYPISSLPNVKLILVTAPSYNFGDIGPLS